MRIEFSQGEDIRKVFGLLQTMLQQIGVDERLVIEVRKSDSKTEETNQSSLVVNVTLASETIKRPTVRLENQAKILTEILDNFEGNQSDLAAKTRIKPSTLSAYISGAFRIGTKAAQKILKATGLSQDDALAKRLLDVTREAFRMGRR